MCTTCLVWARLHRPLARVSPRLWRLLALHCVMIHRWMGAGESEASLIQLSLVISEETLEELRMKGSDGEPAEEVTPEQMEVGGLVAPR